ncbi:MAG: ATP-binding protein, partial [Deltaproteobacteria bacterium]|nr:ATP-binding protein [Deltaproteobacteria bacterium]
PGLPSLLAETASLADGTIASIRDLVGSLDAPLFRPGGLEPAVRQLAFQLGRSGCTLSVDAAGLAGMRPSRATEVCAFRVVQEAVTNAVRHAAPCRIEVRLEGRPDGLAVSVCDDGPGAGAAREGHGLRGMRERVTLLGGTLTVRSTGGGFAVTALVPWLPEEPPRPEEDLHG